MAQYVGDRAWEIVTAGLIAAGLVEEGQILYLSAEVCDGDLQLTVNIAPKEGDTQAVVQKATERNVSFAGSVRGDSHGNK